jgi:very-short-patch-repair endonuclease
VRVSASTKKTYAERITLTRKLGLGSPLAKLFVHAVVIPPSDADSSDRARSATEAFLYRRLETLAETAGRFRLNAQLPIPFDGWGRMEVDLLCELSHIAIELDGRQHLGDAEAYRRDRRKDALLQENGYRVLRFLADDVGKCLDQVLDAILRALAHQNARI